MIRSIIFDLGNVIINYNQKRIINNFTEKEDEIKYIYDEIFHASEWTLMDLGEITNDEAIEAINKRNEFKYDKLTEEFLHEWYKKQPINRDIVEIAKRLKEKGYNLNAEECLFIDDDDSGKNYETVNKIGIKGRRIIPNQLEDVKKLLEEFEVII